MKNPVRRGATLLPLLIAVAACGDQGAEPVVAEAAGSRFTIEEAADLLVGENYPNEIQVPYTLAELWIDYTLLAHALSERPDLTQLDLSTIVQQQVEQEVILTLRSQEVQPDTVVSEEEVQRRFTELSPGARARARHIFLATPQEATPVQRDSVRALAASLRDRVVRGESFEQLARQYSADQASAAEGGDLGWIGKNELVGALDSAIFSLQPGEVSDVVESVYGLHVLRLEEIETPTLEDVRPDVRAFIQQERVQAAESVLIARVEENADMEVQPGAVELVRRAAETPGMQLSRRARNRALVTFRGGELDMNDLLGFMQSRNSQFRIEIYNATDEAIENNLLLALAQRKLLAAEAEARGVTIDEAGRQAIAADLRSRLVEAAGLLGLTSLPAGDAAGRAAREQHIKDLLRDMLRGTRDVTPLGSFSFVLRERYGGQVSLPAVQLVVDRIQTRRGSAVPPSGDSSLPLGTSPLPPGDVPAPPEQPD